VQREAYDGPVMDIDMSVMNLLPGKDTEANGQTPERGTEDFHHRPPTRSGGRNMQESSFAFSGMYRVAPGLILKNLAWAGFEMANLAGARYY